MAADVAYFAVAGLRALRVQYRGSAPGERLVQVMEAFTIHRKWYECLHLLIMRVRSLSIGSSSYLQQYTHDRNVLVSQAPF